MAFPFVAVKKWVEGLQRGAGLHPAGEETVGKCVVTN